MEIILELIIEALLRPAANSKVPLWIRLLLVTLVFGALQTVFVLATISAFSFGIGGGVICCIMSAAWLALYVFVLYKTITLRAKPVKPSKPDAEAELGAGGARACRKK